MKKLFVFNQKIFVSFVYITEKFNFCCIKSTKLLDNSYMKIIDKYINVINNNILNDINLSDNINNVNIYPKIKQYGYYNSSSKIL